MGVKWGREGGGIGERAGAPGVMTQHPGSFSFPDLPAYGQFAVTDIDLQVLASRARQIDFHRTRYPSGRRGNACAVNIAAVRGKLNQVWRMAAGERLSQPASACGRRAYHGRRARTGTALGFVCAAARSRANSQMSVEERRMSRDQVTEVKTLDVPMRSRCRQHHVAGASTSGGRPRARAR